jgi:transposase
MSNIIIVGISLLGNQKSSLCPRMLKSSLLEGSLWSVLYLSLAPGMRELFAPRYIDMMPSQRNCSSFPVLFRIRTVLRDLVGSRIRLRVRMPKSRKPKNSCTTCNHTNIMESIKHAVGIDISMDSIMVCFGSTSANQQKEYSASVPFSNNKKGFKELLQWTKKQAGKSTAPVHFVMEATGSYYEGLAYFLDERKLFVSVILPNKMKNYAKSLDNKSKTDRLDSRVQSQFGLERELTLWHAPSQLMKEIKFLLRERQSIIGMRTSLRNQLHAKDHSVKPNADSLKRNKQTIALFKQQIKDIEKRVKELVASDPDLSERLKHCTKAKGLGWITVMTVVSEANNFVLVRSCKQLASYAGYDVVLNESGKKARKTHISKHGNSRIRKAMYLPALSACRSNPRYKPLYERLSEKTNIKGIGIVAVARKLLLLIYTLWTKNQTYDPQYGTHYA